MNRFVPRSLVAQIAVVMAVTLLIAQLINFTLILNDRQRLSLAQNEGPAINRFVGIARQMTGAATFAAFCCLLIAQRHAPKWRHSERRRATLPLAAVSCFGCSSGPPRLWT